MRGGLRPPPASHDSCDDGQQEQRTHGPEEMPAMRLAPGAEVQDELHRVHAGSSLNHHRRSRRRDGAGERSAAVSPGSPALGAGAASMGPYSWSYVAIGGG